jgi:epoxyqueuosine reductase
MKNVKKINRRHFLKAGTATGAVLGGAGLGFFGFESGRNPSSRIGWLDYQDDLFRFNRQRFAVQHPHYKIVGKTRRVDARTEVIFERFYQLMTLWNEKIDIRSLNPLMKNYYNRFPGDLSLDLRLVNHIYQKRLKDKQKYGWKYILSNAWSKAMGAVIPPQIQYPPEISDFPGGERFGEPSEPLKMKNSEKTSRLIKKIGNELGATLIGISRLNPDWVYLHPLRNRGLKVNKPLRVPDHWVFAIVIAIPMSWELIYANPNYGTSNDAYSRVRIVAYRLASFIRQLGYAARPHTPEAEYDVMVPPIAIDAGLGEQGRHSVVISPELGSNFQAAVVTTNLPLIPDKPIEFGVQDFCRDCTICADYCPSGAISKGNKVEIRGYQKYQIDISRCHNFWYSNLGNIGCRICLAVCPFTRKSGWLHRGALEISAHDPTRVSNRLLKAMHKFFYQGPKSDRYYSPAFGGDNASYREPPWWLKTEDFIERF